MNLKDKLTLPCGVVLPNRIGKSAMSENMAYPKFTPGDKFYRAYKMWIDGGTGLCVSGNVMIDSRHLGEANNVVIEEGIDNTKELKKWAQSKEGSESQIWIQLNHPGKQTPKFLTPEPVGPSAVALKPPLDKMFNTPRELNENEIRDIIKRFAYAAGVVKRSGFNGVQIHGAHGYLVSQFLSEVHNKRSDQWGGTLENRMRFVLEVYKAIREEVGVDFPIGVKLNTADFGRGGFSQEDAINVAKSLSDHGIDLLEISGGTYEAATMTGKPIKKSTQKREAYFLEYADDIKKVISCPLMVTGGFRTSKFIRSALEEGNLDMIGLGRSLCLNPKFSSELISGQDVSSEVKPLTSGFKFLDTMFPLEIIWYTMQIHRMGAGMSPDSNLSVYRSIWGSFKEIGLSSIKRVRAKTPKK
jgi:2,4-dienoyl-CoA reductase-like NADH-dependent reductase (Old Yellow Enzyme family)